MSREVVIRLSDEQHKQLIELMDTYQKEGAPIGYSDIGNFVKFILQTYGLIDFSDDPPSSALEGKNIIDGGVIIGHIENGELKTRD